MKRLFDIICSATALIILSPILIPVFIILKFTGEGEIFYRQKRIGKGNKPFFITKFATMLKDSPNIGTREHTLQDDPRVLPFGKLLRKTKINELPQIWDILIGNMSIVGPRPTTPSHHALYPSEYLGLMEQVSPGLTGVGSIVFRDEETILSNAVDFDKCYANEIVPYKAELERWYVNHQSMLVDIMLCFITAWVVFFPKSEILFKSFKTIPKKDIHSFGKY